MGWCITAVSCGFLVLRVCGLSAASGFGCFLRCWWVDSAVMVVWFVHFVLCWFRFVFGFVCGLVVMSMLGLIVCAAIIMRVVSCVGLRL